MEFHGNGYDNEIIQYSTEENLWLKNFITIHDTRSFTNQPGNNNDLPFAKIKEMLDIPDFSSAMVHYASTNIEESHFPYSTSYNVEHEEQYCSDHQGLGENLSLINIFSGPQITDDHQHLGGVLYSSGTQNINASLGVHPLPSRRFDYLNNIASINTSLPDMKNLPSSSLFVSKPLGLKLKANSDLLYSIYNYGGRQCHGQSSADNQVQESSNSSSNSSNKRSASLNGVPRRRSNSSTPKASSTAAKKKPQFGSESSKSEVKARQEKVGDRIAALQRLVAPFGKTDTASILTEAIGYIQFLQDQIQTLSLPNKKSSGRKTYKGMLAVSSQTTNSPYGGSNEEELKQDLRSRGLCLMPISCTSFISSCNGGSIIWTTPI